jgi:hypothetical protein
MCDVKDKNVLSHTPLLDLPPYIPLASGEGYSNIKFEEGAEFVFSIEPEGEGKEVRVWDVKIVKIGLPGDYIHVGGDNTEDWTNKPFVEIEYLTGEEGKANYGGYYNIDDIKVSTRQSMDMGASRLWPFQDVELR